MTLELAALTLDGSQDPELQNFRRRLFWTLPLTVIVTMLAMAGPRLQWFDVAAQSWIEPALTLPVVLWAGMPFFKRAVQSLLHTSPNTWTLIGLTFAALRKPVLFPSRR